MSHKPIGPSSDDYHSYLGKEPHIRSRLTAAPISMLHVGYEVWRNAWLACEIEHGIRRKDWRESPPVLSSKPTDPIPVPRELLESLELYARRYRGCMNASHPPAFRDRLLEVISAAEALLKPTKPKKDKSQ